MKKTQMKLAAKVLAVALIFPIAANGECADAKKSAAPKLASGSVTVKVSQKKTVKIKNVTAKKVKKLTVTVKNKKIVKAVKSGKTAVVVTGKKAGSTKVTIKVKLKKKTYKLKLSVKVKAKSKPAQTEEPLPTVPPTTNPVVINDEITIPGSFVKDEKDLTYEGVADLGGTGEQHIYKDTAGVKWLFKPAQSKAGEAQVFRAYIQEAAYKVQYVIDPSTAVEVGIGILGGKFGAYQRMLEVDSNVKYQNWQSSVHTGEPQSEPVTEMTQDALAQFMREFVTDWLLGNYDCHGRNFVTTTDGVLYGVDKEQSFRYLDEPESAAMSTTFHPNEQYGEEEPIYNTIFSQYKEGKLALDTSIPYKYIDRIEQVPDEYYREIFRRYAEAVKGEGEAAEEFLDKIVERKKNIRKVYDEFIASLK